MPDRNEDKPVRFGIIDIGTLKVKCAVFELGSGGTIREILRSNILTCFGLDMDKNNNRVQEKFLQKTIGELHRCKREFKKLGVERTHAVSTHILRVARNANDVLSAIRSATDLSIDVISQQREAQLLFSAALTDFADRDEQYIVIDVGGGSVQVLIGFPDDEPEIHLLDTGTQILHERFTHHPHNPQSRNSPGDIRALTTFLKQKNHNLPRDLRFPLVYGSSNVIDVMKAISLPLESFLGSPSHPFKTTPGRLREFVNYILPLTFEEREQRYTVQTGYLWGIDKAFTNVAIMAEHFGSATIIPSNANIGRGLALELLQAHSHPSNSSP